MNTLSSAPYYQARLLIDLPCMHGESPVWHTDQKRLYWVDMFKCRIYGCESNGENLFFNEFEEPVCALHPEANSTFLVALAKRIVRVDMDSGKILETLAEVEPEISGNRCNDGKMDPSGNFWIGTMSNSGSVQGAGSLYRFGKGRLDSILTDLTIANGMGWTLDQKTMFFIDTPTREVKAFDFDPFDSSIKNSRSVVTLPDELGLPDGMCVAPDGTIWIAGWGSGTVSHWDPSTGRLIEVVITGVPHTSSCALGDNGSLYITTSRLGLSDSQINEAPLSGAVFVHQS